MMLVGHLKNYFNISQRHCTREKRNILIINRKAHGNRRMLNSVQLKHLLEIKTGQNVNLVYLEDFPLQKQMKIIVCTDILIGIHGAGLAWYDDRDNNYPSTM